MMPTRKAIIIRSPDEGESFLPGTLLDSINFINYLRSPRGGSWYEDEISILEDPNWRTVLSIVYNTLADYLIIYFTGHGGTLHEKRVVKLKDGLLEDRQVILGPSPRQLMIVDACRNYLGAISGIPEYDEYNNFSGESVSRSLFDRFILNSLPGKMIIHGTTKGFPAKEVNGLGGVFTYYLLHAALKLKLDTDYTGVSVTELIGHAEQKIHEDGFDQVPSLAYKEGWLTVPFMIAAPQIVINGTNPIGTVPKFTDGQRLLAGMMIMVGFYHAFKQLR
jgi:hypothetical protein